MRIFFVCLLLFLLCSCELFPMSRKELAKKKRNRQNRLPKPQPPWEDIVTAEEYKRLRY